MDKKQKSLKTKDKLADDKITKLDKIDMVWHIYKDKWYKNYLFAKEYYEKHGHLLVDDSHSQLKDWIIHNRTKRKNGLLTEEQIELLDNINMVWDVHRQEWFENYQLLVDYYNENKNIFLPKEYKVNGFNLYAWMLKQRSEYKKGTLDKIKIDYLNKIGMIWDTQEAKWLLKYSYAKEYYEQHGNLYLIYDYKGILGWLNNNRKLYENNMLKEKQINLLNEIGMIWDVDHYRFLHQKISKYKLKLLEECLYETLNAYDDNYKFTCEDDVTQIRNDFIKRVYKK